MSPLVRHGDPALFTFRLRLVLPAVWRKLGRRGPRRGSHLERGPLFGEAPSKPLNVGTINIMATVEELWQLAQDLYARARASIDPATKRMLMNQADDLLKQADELRRSHVVESRFDRDSE